LIIAVYAKPRATLDIDIMAITNRLKTVNQLRKVCLSLANSSAGEKPENKPPTSNV
jgi:hypothetical protein